MTITPAELAADRAADAAAENLRQFRLAHWAYFASTERVLPNGTVLPRVRNDALERESMRLFDIVRRANKLALDLEKSTSSVGN